MPAHWLRAIAARKIAPHDPAVNVILLEAWHGIRLITVNA